MTKRLISNDCDWVAALESYTWLSTSSSPEYRLTLGFNELLLALGSSLYQYSIQLTKKSTNR